MLGTADVPWNRPEPFASFCRAGPRASDAIVRQEEIIRQQQDRTNAPYAQLPPSGQSPPPPRTIHIDEPDPAMQQYQWFSEKNEREFRSLCDGLNLSSQLHLIPQIENY